MLNFLREFIKPKYETLNKIVIKADNIIANLNYLKSLQPTAEIFPVLKSNAYGHGLKEICQILNKTAVPLVAVDSYPEAQIVYRYFKGKVLILGEMPLKAYRYCHFKRTEFVVYNEETLKYLARFGKKVCLHLFVNSGMNREGIKNLDNFVAKNKKYLNKVELTGLCSHLASAENDSSLNEKQADNFAAALDTLRANGFFPRWIHLGNSAAVFTLNNSLLTAYRPGLSLYGYSPFKGDFGGQELPLKPALTVFSHIISLQDLKAGESVSYNEEYRAKAPARIATIPFGYFEGLDRRLSNQAKFLVQTESYSFWAKIAGQVCMNLTCLDVNNQELKIGDIVTVVSDNPTDPNSVASLANLINTIPYEFLVKLQANIRRVIV
ncbi:MAG: alanine racemase [Patescibacteria group bacterium]